MLNILTRLPRRIRLQQGFDRNAVNIRLYRE
jgi:hypothetical protein